MATTTDHALVHAAATVPLAPQLTLAEEVVKFVRGKPLGASGAVIILGMLLVAAFAGALAPVRPLSGQLRAPVRAAQRRATGSAPTSSGATS